MLNNVVLVGRVVRQPELIQTQEGKKSFDCYTGRNAFL